MPNQKTVTLAALSKTRELVAIGPSGNTYKIRPLNMERYALAGHLPTALRQLAMQGAAGIDAALAGDELLEKGPEIREYMDSLVRQVIVEPDLADVDLDLLPPVDYKWVVRIAMSEEDHDGEGRRLWGRAPLSIWGTFRDEHGCAEDCPSCDRARRPVAEIQ